MKFLDRFKKQEPQRKTIFYESSMRDPSWKIAQKESRVDKLSIKEGINQYPPKDYELFANETYLLNAIVYRCIDYIGKAIGQVEWNIYTEKNGERVEVENSPLNDLLKRPNPNESLNALISKIGMWLKIAGNSFLERVAPTTGPNRSTPKELYVLRPDKFVINLNTNGSIKSYTYDNTEVFEVDENTGNADILQFKLFNPTNDFWGASPIESAAKIIDSSNESDNWNKKILENEGRPGMVLTVKGSLTDQQYDRLEKKIDGLYKGSKNAGRSLILESDFDISAVPYNWSPKEMDFLESNKELARKLCMAFGVPAQLIGIPDVSTYANYKEARLAFWEEDVIWNLNYIRDELNNWLFYDQNIFIDYDINKIPAFVEKQAIKWERAQNSDFLTINEKRELVGIDKVDGGDVILIPINMIPLGSEVPEINEESASKKIKDEGFDQDDIDSILDMPHVPQRVNNA